MQVLISISAAPKGFTWYIYKGNKITIGTHKEYDLTVKRGDKIGLKFAYGKWIAVDASDPSIKFRVTEKERKQIIDKSKEDGAAPAKAKKAVKPVKEKKVAKPKKAETEKKASVDLNALARKQIEGKPLSKEEYESDPRIGVPFHTGRQGPTATAITVGFRNYEGKPRMVSVTPHKKQHMRYLHSRATMHDYQIPQTAGKKVSYERYLQEVKNLNSHVQDKGEREADRDKKSGDIATQLRDKLKEGNVATIQFSNGVFKKHIMGIDYRKQAIGIKGSGRKLRWIPFHMIKDANPPA